ncbi:MAG: hypothetical protein KAH30_01420 [Caldisericia bacterium]|nr:hypothetical protein [Caldisericia bacterium]
MRKALVFVLLITLTISLVACGGGTDDGNGDVVDNGKVVVNWGDENPNAGTIITNEPGDRENTLSPEKPKGLIGELKIPPHPRMLWTCYEIDGLDVIGNSFEFWNEVERTAESWDAKIVHSFSYEKDPSLVWSISYEMVPELGWEQLEYFEDKLDTLIDGEITEQGKFKHTESMATGLWVTYKNGDNLGRKMFYTVRGKRVDETTFGDGFAVTLSAEGPVASFTEAWETDNLDYMFQEVMITQPMAN